MIIDMVLPYDRKTWVLTQVIPPILDVGCGPRGWIFSDTVFHQYTTYLDIDLRKMENFINADAHNIPMRSKSFNTVYLGEILEHVADPRRVLDEAVRTARLRVVFTTPDEHHWSQELKPFYPLERRLREEGLSKEELFKRDNPDALTMKSVETNQAWHRRYYDDKSILKLLKPYKYGLWRTYHPGGWVFYSGLIQV